MNRTLLFFIILAVIFLAWIAFGYFGSRVELLPYTVISNDKEYEIREIPEHIIAETTVKGSFDDASGSSFNILAGYIFGDNRRRESIAMTGPVIESESEKIAMTAPVLSTESEGDERVFAFVMPSQYTLENLPEPNDSRVKIKKVESKEVAVLQFSGFYSEKKIEEKKELLKQYLERDGLEYGTVYWAGYNPPWTPPFMRRLEVWADLIK